MPIAYVTNGENGDDLRVKLNSIIDIANAAVQANDPLDSLSETLVYKLFTADERVRLNTTLVSGDIGVTVAPFIKHVYDGTRAPNETDDTSEGYVAGSTWIYGLITYKCFDATENNAVWGLTSLTSEDLGSAAFTDSSEYAPAAQGVTGGNAHDHNGGDGGQISYNNLADLPSLVTGGNTHNHSSGDGGQISYNGLADLPSLDFASSDMGVTNGNTHNHSSGDGGQISYNGLADLPSLDFASSDMGVTGGNAHNHNGGDGGQIDYSSLSGLPTLGTASAADASAYAPAAQGVTGGNAHNHEGGDGGQIAYSSLSGLPTLGSAAATSSSAYAPAAQGVTGGNAHNHDGGDGGQIAYSSLSGLPTFGSAAWTPVSNYAPSNMGVTGGNTHDHNGGDGGQIAYSSLSGLPTFGSAAWTPVSDYAPAAQGVTGGNTHDHNGGDGGQIAYSSLSGLPTLPSGAVVGTTDSQTLESKTLVDPVITGAIKEDIYTIIDGSGFEIDPSKGTIQLITLGANRAPKGTNFVAGESVLLMVLDGFGYSLTWTSTTFGSSGVKWIGGSYPTLDTSKYTCIKLWKVGSQVYGMNWGAVSV